MGRKRVKLTKRLLQKRKDARARLTSAEQQAQALAKKSLAKVV